MSEIKMSTRNTTLYTVKRPGRPDFETFDYDKAQQMAGYVDRGVPAAECVDCKAVIPIALVDQSLGRLLEVEETGQTLGNACPATLSGHHLGHRVAREEYEAASGS